VKVTISTLAPQRIATSVDPWPPPPLKTPSPPPTNPPLLPPPALPKSHTNCLCKKHFGPRNRISFFFLVPHLTPSDFFFPAAAVAPANTIPSRHIWLCRGGPIIYYCPPQAMGPSAPQMFSGPRFFSVARSKCCPSTNISRSISPRRNTTF